MVGGWFVEWIDGWMGGWVVMVSMHGHDAWTCGRAGKVNGLANGRM